MKELTSEGAGREGLDKWGSKGKMDNEGHKNVFSKSNDFGTRCRVQTDCDSFISVVRWTKIIVSPSTEVVT